MYGLLGKNLEHSLSKDIHEFLGTDDYELIETDDPATFIKQKQFSGINITMPYKRQVVQYCDVLSESVKRTNVANTIVNRNGTLYAYNTDYEALVELFKNQFIDTNDSIAIIGNGATASSVCAALETLNHTNIVQYARNPIANQKPITALAKTHHVLINTTPVGMFPANDAFENICFEQHKDLKLVFDVVYNPLKTHLILAAEKAQINTLVGLPMLILQAIKSHVYFTQKNTANLLAESLYKFLFLKTANLAFIGLPYSGKTTYAKIMGNRLNKSFIDVDICIENNTNMSISDFFKTKGEPAFRTLESEQTIAIAQNIGQSIGTGGGIIKNTEAMHALKQSSIILYLDLSDSLLEAIYYHGRPLAKDKVSLLELKKERHALYQKYADIVIHKNTLQHDTIMHQIEVKIHAYIDYQWSQLKLTR